MNNKFSWVLNLFNELKRLSSTKISYTQHKSTPAALFSFETPPSIQFFETQKKDGVFFEFETDDKKYVFNCDLNRYPQLIQLIRKHCPTKNYTIEDPWKKERLKAEKQKNLRKEANILEKQRKSLEIKQDDIEKRLHDLDTF